MVDGRTRTGKVVNQLKNTSQTPREAQGEQLVSFGGAIIPNHSGDHSAGKVLKTPVNDSDIVNKKYVDDNAYTDADAVAAVAAADDYLLNTGDTGSGDYVFTGTIDASNFDTIDGTTENVNIGVDVDTNSAGVRNVCIGKEAGKYLTHSAGQDGWHNVNIGFRSGAGYTAGSSTSQYNVFIGESSGQEITSGQANVGIGFWSLLNNTTGGQNFGLGTYSMNSNTTGYSNVGIGRSSLQNNTTAYHNVAIGTNASFNNTTGWYNVVLGSEAMYYNQAGAQNVILGYQAGGYNNGSVDDINYNVAMGYKAGYSMTSNRNVLLGWVAGYLLTSGEKNVFVGCEAGRRQTTASNLLIIDNQDRSSAANEATNSLIYGTFNSSPSSQILKINGNLYLTQVKSGATQAGAGASAGEVWKTSSHASLPDNVLMIGV